MTVPRCIVVDRENTERPPRDFAAVSSALGGVSPEDLRDIAVWVGKQATELIRSMRGEFAGEGGHVAVDQLKSSAVDPVTAVDKASERLIREELLAATPGARVLGEEEGVDASESQEGAGGLLWVVDPIDGTVNFIYGIPAFSVSIAATVGGVPVAAAVIDVMAGRAYSAACGGEARCDEFGDANANSPQRILTIPEESASDAALGSALVATGFSYLATRRKAQAELLVKVLPKVRDIRRIGSAALDLCFIAEGKIDAYFEHGLGPWDHAAGVLIAARAGAIVSMPTLDVNSNEGVQVTAAKPGVYEPLQELLKQHVSGGAVEPVSAV